MTTSAQWENTLIPAHLAFLAIYNPTLGPTDETFRDQLVFYYSRATTEARATRKKDGKARGSKQNKHDGHNAGLEDVSIEDENSRLRQIGLAQGMLDFARSFSKGSPVESIDTEKSRIVLHELEKGWWILASISLTRLPATKTSATSTSVPLKHSHDSKHNQTSVKYDYSSREVSPSSLLIQQLIQAHSVFSLHHGPSLSELFIRLPREKFCSTLERYWSRFSKSWDVLLHANPAVDVLTATKLASGGELGFGVGEEEWGSGERAVLEEIANQTEGLVDLVVARYGEPAQTSQPTQDNRTIHEAESLPWAASGTQPAASDGLVFTGINALTSTSLRSISLWMRHIYTYGEHAYAVRDNPGRERRKRRRRNVNEASRSTSTKTHASRPSADSPQTVQQQETPTATSETPPRVQDRVASQDHAADRAALPRQESYPGIPPPIVSAAEAALNKATQDAEQGNRSSDEQEEQHNEAGTTMGIPDQYMKYLTFGLSTLGKPTPKKRPVAPHRTPTSTSSRPAPTNTSSTSSTAVGYGGADLPALSFLDPRPDGEALHAKIALQKQQEDNGYFIIGLTGDLDNTSCDDDDEADATEGSLPGEVEGSRTIVRTLHVELNRRGAVGQDVAQESIASELNAKTDMARLRVVIYARRPFLYCFLFEQRTSSLSWAGFYRSMHRNLLTIHKPLLSSTSVIKVTERIEAAHADRTDASSATTNTLPTKAQGTAPIYDLLYDPATLTVHSSLPNIPEPGTPAAEGILTRTNTHSAPATNPWTRLEALNVHSAILKMLADTTHDRNQLEWTSKTSRGWWVVWMRLPPSGKPEDNIQDQSHNKAAASSTATLTTDDNNDTTIGGTAMTERLIPDMHRVAFLIRKAGDSNNNNKPSSTRPASSMWTSLALRSQPDENNAGDRSYNSLGNGGIGFDARTYVEGLLSLNR